MGMNEFDSWLSELRGDAAATEDLLRVALRLVFARAQRDPEFKALLTARPADAFRALGVAGVLNTDRALVVVSEEALVLRIPKTKSNVAQPRPLRPVGGGGGEDPPEEPPPRPNVGFRGSAHHWASNPFSGGHKGIDTWWVTLPTNVEHENIGFADGSGQVTLLNVETFLTSNSESRTTTVKLDIRWWYNMWSDVRYDFAIFTKTATNEVEPFYFGQDDGAPPTGPILWSAGRIDRVLDGVALDITIQPG